ncbi:MAG: sigma-54-dependent Fis family transcriptional regulator [Burkholderiales bacterium]|nr:sigma-54-dependent Fis family transcriptional regulator [Burkholderiales bacterium]OJX05256.1 MAG: hypothetical protein BGO72_13550 [Burkholderiales bacterium 70-64]
MTLASLPVAADERTRLARTHFFNGNVVPNGLVADEVARSWERCAGLGMDASARTALPMVTAAELRSLRERNRLLLEVAQPELENLYQQIANTRSVVILTDAEATVLSSISLDGPLMRTGGRPGACWVETHMGTNAIGTAVVAQRPVAVLGDEHYREQMGAYFCAAAPLFDPFGNLAGVLDLSGGEHVRQGHLRALVGMSARVIESRLFFAQMDTHTIVRFHSRPEFLGTLWEALAVFDRTGTLQAANRAALQVLEIDRRAIGRDHISAFFDIDAARLPEAVPAPGSGPILMHLHSGIRVYAGVRAPAETPRGKARASGSPPAAPFVPPRPPAAAQPAGAAAHGARRGELRLSDIVLGDSAMHELLEKARRAFEAGIPVLLEGETGTGKEVLARALHRESARAGGPFVAINCASIPETLIEAELFGYRDGAFTGARRGGAIGQLQQADKGTLLLDEIGDMPLALQARLLRALQERCVVPLGGDKAVPIDIAVICATHMNLRERVSAGLFRQDLYYRLNGLRVALPPLRDRANLRAIIDGMIRGQSAGDEPITLSDEALEALLGHPWPGNLRQLASVIATALALLGEERCIGMQHLTDDFLREMIEQQPVRTDAPAACAAGTLAALEVQAVQRALERHGGNISAAAASLGIGRATLYRKLKQQRG